MPIGGRHALDGWAEVEKACEAIGRDPKTVELSIFGAKPDRASLDELAEQGVQKAVIALPQGPRDEVMAALDEHAKLLN